MMMTALQRLANFESFISTADCPFFDATRNLCRAALLNYMPEAKQVFFYCSTDDHDNCALFLARALRSSNPGGVDRDTAIHCGK
jgi:hypothetical protein